MVKFVLVQILVKVSWRLDISYVEVHRRLIFSLHLYGDGIPLWRSMWNHPGIDFSWYVIVHISNFEFRSTDRDRDLESTTTTSTTTTTFSPDQFLLSSASAPAISSNSNPIGNPSSNTAANKTANDDSDTNTKMNLDVDSCARASTHCATTSREYAFSDCSEIYLSGKRNSGIYEIW